MAGKRRYIIVSLFHYVTYPIRNSEKINRVTINENDFIF